MTPDFDWDEDDNESGNVAKIATHGITPTEAEDAVLDPDAVPTRADSTPTERRRGIIGMTEHGRILVVVYTIRRRAIRVVTAYDASQRMKRQYRRHKD